MDTSIIFIIGIVILILGFSIGLMYADKKDYIDLEGLINISKMFDLSMRIINELNLTQEKYIKLIGDIVNDSLEYAKSYFDTNKDIIEESYKYALELCEQFNIEITEERQKIIKELIMIGLGNKYIKNI